MPDPSRRQRRRRRLARAMDGILVGLTLVFAFFIASFAIRNSDFWQHLAAGRLLAQGAYRFGDDPFAYTTGEAYWANHAWLFDLGLYGIYQAAGGTALVVLKALAVVGLAALLLSIRRPGTGYWLPAACTTLALLAMSPGLLLQPTLVSYLFLGLTLWLLSRPYLAKDCVAGAERLPSLTRAQGLSAFCPGHLIEGVLLALFVVWVNLDAWFLLGPLMVALFWLGERLGDNPRRIPGWLVPASLAVCLLNPHHIHAFTLPTELSPAVWTSGLAESPRFREHFLSPWQLEHYLRPSTGLNAAGLAYFVLTALGLASFALGRRGLRDWRLPVWLLFAGLAAWQVRGVPFFAVVSGPITALNLGDWLLRRQPAVGGVPALAGLWGRAGLVLALLALAVLNWPGWLQAAPTEQHRVAWEVQPDPSLQRLAETLNRWRQEDRLAAEERVFASHPDVAHYGAWFCPGERSFLDQRLPLFASVAPQYEAVCRALEAGPKVGAGPGEDWQQVLREHQVGALILYDRDLSRLPASLHRLLPGPHSEWVLSRIDGRVLVFRRSARGPEPRRAGGLVEQLAYVPRDKAAALPPAPDEGVTRFPQLRFWWERFAWPELPTAWESDAATLYLGCFRELAGRYEQEAWASSLSRYAASLTGLPALHLERWATLSPVLLAWTQAPPFLPDLHAQPPALPLLAICAARRALAVNPDDVNAWLRLGQAYLALDRLTWERTPAGYPEQPRRPLELLRLIQAATALKQALTLAPELEPAHRVLGELYAERAYLDAALEHAQAAVRLTRQAGPADGEGAKEFEARLALEEQKVQALDQEVRDRKNQFVVQSDPLVANPLARARLAVRLGLAQLALDEVLLKSSVKLFGGEGARLQLELMLMLGRADRVRTMLDDDEMRRSKQVLGAAEFPAPLLPGYGPSYHLPSYEWLRFYQAAATGDYGAAHEALGQVLGELELGEQQNRQGLHRSLALALTSEVGLAMPPSGIGTRVLVRGVRERLSGLLAEANFLALERADLSTLGGLLALEQGLPILAEKYFRSALAASGQQTFVFRPVALAYLRQLEAAQRAQGEGRADNPR